MNTNCMGIIISIFYFGMVFFGLFLISKKTKIDDFVKEKIVFILTSTWWIILIYFIKSSLLAIMIILIFLFINSLFLFYPTLIKSFNFKNRKYNISIYNFTFSFLVLTIFVYLGRLEIYAATIGIFLVGYANSLSSIFSKLWKKKQILLNTGYKTIFGTILMFLFSFIIIFAVLCFMSSMALNIILILSLLISLVATLLELITPRGLDSISIPLLCALLTGVIV